MRTLIVDDEPVARELLHQLLAGHPGIELLPDCGDGDAAIAAITAGRPELLLLDIDLPGPDGFQVLEAVPASERPAVVFVTAHEEFARQAFDYHALDYLLKPVVASRLYEAVERCMALVSSSHWQDLRQRLEAFVQLRAEDEPDRGRGRDQWITVRQGRTRVPLRWEQVDWVQSAGNYVRIHSGTSVYLLRSTVQMLERRLLDKGFVRVHRQALVQRARVAGVDPSGHGDFELRLVSGQRIRMSRRYRQLLAERRGHPLEDRADPAHPDGTQDPSPNPGPPESYPGGSARPRGG